MIKLFLLLFGVLDINFPSFFLCVFCPLVISRHHFVFCSFLWFHPASSSSSPRTWFLPLRLSLGMKNFSSRLKLLDESFEDGNMFIYRGRRNELTNVSRESTDSFCLPGKMFGRRGLRNFIPPRRQRLARSFVTSRSMFSIWHRKWLRRFSKNFVISISMYTY